MSYIKNYDNINWGNSNIPKKTNKKYGKSYQIMSDIEEFVSPIDKSVIGSRSKLRAHERQHGVRQIGNDWNGKEETNSVKPQNWNSWNEMIKHSVRERN